MRISIFILLLIPFGLLAQPNVKLNIEKTKNGYAVYADNPNSCPSSVQIDFNLTNLKDSNKNNTVYVIKPNVSQQLLTSLSIINTRAAYSVKLSTLYNYGNHLQTSYDSSFIYHLPYSKSKSSKIIQGYNGNKTHFGKNALDFEMKIGTKILAARGGIVIEIIDKNKKHCKSQECVKYNNHIIIYHQDGTFAEYAHIKQNGALVKVGDTIKQDQPIALSGNVGWTYGPHLHFDVYLQKLKTKETLKTLFKTENSNEKFLKEKKSYLKTY